tara:strand:- start:1739 stop:2137 length:399 start_codon:yes stop_codon:yes gene_type:complete
MTKKQRIALWRKVSGCFDPKKEGIVNLIQSQIGTLKKPKNVGPCSAHAYQQDWDEERMDRIGQNGNDGVHYEEIDKIIRQQQEAEPGLFRYEDAENGRWNWYGDGDSDATSMDDDLPSAAEDCARQRGNYEI